MSTEKKETIYCGNGKKVTTQYGDFRAVTINLTDLPSEFIFEYNGKKYIKLNVNDKKEADKYGKDVSVSINTWKPDQEAIVSSKAIVEETSDLPF